MICIELDKVGWDEGALASGYNMGVYRFPS